MRRGGEVEYCFYLNAFSFVKELLELCLCSEGLLLRSLGAGDYDNWDVRHNDTTTQRHN